MGNKPIQDCGFFLFGTGNPRLLVVTGVLLVPVRANARCLLCLYVQSGGFLVFLALCAPFSSNLFSWTSQVRLVLVVWGAALLEKGYPKWTPARNVKKDLLCLAVLSFVTVGHWVIRRPHNGSGRGLLELLLCRSLEFVVLALPMVHSAHLQQGRALRVLGMNCLLHQSEFRICPKVVLDSLFRFADGWCARLAES